MTGCLRPTPVDNLPILAGIEPAELLRKWATLPLSRRAMKSHHAPLISHPFTGWERSASQIKKPIFTSRTTTHQFIWRRQQSAALWAYHRKNVDWSAWRAIRNSVLSSLTSAPIFPEWPCQEQSGSGLTAYAQVSDVSASACTNGVWPLLRLASVGQKNKPWTMLSSTG